MEQHYKYKFKSILLTIIIVEAVLFLAMALAYFTILAPLKAEFRFENSFLLLGLFVPPLMTLVYALMMAWKNRALDRFTDHALLKHLIPDISTTNSLLKFVLTRMGVMLIIIGLANPQFGTTEIEAKSEGIDIMVALDVSNSMKAEDLAPNRLERAKRAIEKLISELHGDRLGIIIFGGEAYVQLPITTDYSAAKLFLQSIDTDIIPTQGTAIGAAIDLAMESFDFENGINKAIVVITDGENHEDDAAGAAEYAADKGVMVSTIGMGSAQGEPIPIYKKGRQIGYKKDGEGNTVITKLNETMLKEIAAAGDGVYVRASNAQVGLSVLLNELKSLDKTEFDTVMYADYEDRFYIFIGLGLLLIVLEFFINEKRSKLAQQINLFE